MDRRWTTRRSGETGTETNHTACQDEKDGDLATYLSGRNRRGRHGTGGCPDLKASPGDAVKQKSEVCKLNSFERQTVIDPIPALLVCALPDGPLNLAAAHARHHENRHSHSKFSTSRMVGDHLGSLRL